MDTKDIKNFVASPTFKKLLWILIAVIIALVVFQAGMFVGFRKASFSFGWGDNYYRTFGDYRGGGMGMIGGRPGFPGGQGLDLPNSYGAAGKIIKVTLPTFVILDNSGIERVVLTNDDTTIRQFRGEIKPENLKVNDSVVIIGSPDDKSEIVAKLIRIMPPIIPPLNNGQTATTTNSSR